MSVWLDENEVQLGDSLRRKIDQGLAESRFGVLILSKAFFAKDWPQRELNVLASMESLDRKVILPIWHGVSHDNVAAYSPMLADKLAISTDNGLEKVAEAVLRATTTPQESKVRVQTAALAKGIWTLYDVDYLSFVCGSMGCSIAVSYREIHENEEVTVQRLAKVATPLWQPAFELLAVLVGHNPSDIAHGRVHGREQKYGNREGHIVLEMNVEGLISLFDEWKSCSALLHFRNWQFLRDVEHDFVDLYFMPYADDTVDYVPVAQGQAALARIIELLKCIKPPLTRLTALTLLESDVGLVIQDPVYCVDCVPVLGGDAYWIKTILQ